MTFSMIFVLVVLFAPILVGAAILDQDTRYGNWPPLYSTDPYVRIPVYIETARYASDATCLTNIQTAITNMNTGLTGCVQFAPIVPLPNSSRGFDFLWISTALNTGTIPGTCQVVPGHVTQNQQGQKLIIGGTALPNTQANCCSGTTGVRDVMRFLAHVLGLRNEYEHPSFQTGTAGVTAFTATNIATALQQFNLFAPYTARAAVFTPNSGTATPLVTIPAAAGNAYPAVDLNSITMVTPTQYAQVATSPVWTGTAPGTQNVLSFADCQAIAYKYGCTGTCADPYG